MKQFNELLAERSKGGAEAGKMELHRTHVDVAMSYARAVLGEEKFSYFKNFRSNYLAAQAKAKMGWTRRKDMPVISTPDSHDLKNRLEKGMIDVSAPFAPTTNENRPFPGGLSGDRAAQWLKNGLSLYDGDSKDDRVNVVTRHVPVGTLNPIQKQIYFDKSIASLAANSMEATLAYHKTQTIYITSSDNFIIDGHHRFLSAMLLDPKLKVQTLSIDMPIKDLLPMSLSYSDAIGNKRNL